MQLYSYFRSSCSYRCRIALNLKGLETEYIPVHLLKGGGEQRQDKYKKLNPQGLVPALVTDDEDIVIQSLAIIEWLDEIYPEPALLPQEPNLRARVRAFGQIIACEIQPLQNTRILQHLSQEFGQDQEQINRWCQRWIGDGLKACEDLLQKCQVKTEFCFGNSPGLAEICLIPQIFSAHRFKVDLDPFKNIRRVYDKCVVLDAFERAHPNNQPDAE